MGISESRLSVLRKEPLFEEAYWNIMSQVNERFVQTRADAMEILQDTAVDAALLAREMVVEGTLGGSEISPTLRSKNVWDVLKASGATMEHGPTTADLADAIVEAYEAKYQKRVRGEVIDGKPKASDTKPLSDQPLSTNQSLLPAKMPMAKETN